MNAPEKPQTIKVESYSGYKADERPISFILGGDRLMVDEIIDQWHGTDSEFFKILADDGNRYLLKCNFNGEWVLEKIFPA